MAAGGGVARLSSGAADASWDLGLDRLGASLRHPPVAVQVLASCKRCDYLDVVDLDAARRPEGWVLVGPGGSWAHRTCGGQVRPCLARARRRHERTAKQSGEARSPGRKPPSEGRSGTARVRPLERGWPWSCHGLSEPVRRVLARLDRATSHEDRLRNARERAEAIEGVDARIQAREEAWRALPELARRLLARPGKPNEPGRAADRVRLRATFEADVLSRLDPRHVVAASRDREPRGHVDAGTPMRGIDG